MGRYFLLCALPLLLFSNPKGEKVVTGDVSFTRGEKLLEAIQTGDQAIVEWDSFSIDCGETVRFHQPHSKASVLNRVVGANWTEIYGSLEADGQVMLINPYGVIFGNTGRVDVASFLASSLDVENSSYLNDEDLFFSGVGGGIVKNEGSITARDGHFILIGPSIYNRGAVWAPNGQAWLVEADGVWIKALKDDQLVVSIVESGEELGALANEGEILASEVHLKGKGNPYQLAINHSERDEATRFKKAGDRIFLIGDEPKNPPKQEKGLNREHFFVHGLSASSLAGSPSVPAVLDDSVIALQQIRSLIPERLWYQEFSLLVNRKAFEKPMKEWTTHKLQAKGQLPRIAIGNSQCYFLRDTISGESVRILDRYTEFLESPFWKSPLYMKDLTRMERKLMGAKR